MNLNILQITIFSKTKVICHKIAFSAYLNYLNKKKNGWLITLTIEKQLSIVRRRRVCSSYPYSKTSFPMLITEN